MLSFKLTDSIQRYGIEALVGNISHDGKYIFMIYENIIKPDKKVIEAELFRNDNGKLISLGEVYTDSFFDNITEKDTGLVTLGYCSDDFKYFVLVELAPGNDMKYILRYRVLIFNIKFIDHCEYRVHNVSNLYATMSPLMDNMFIALYQKENAGHGKVCLMKITDTNVVMMSDTTYRRLNESSAFTSNNMYVVKYFGKYYALYTYEWTKLINLTSFGNPLQSKLCIQDSNLNNIITVDLTSPSLGVVLYKEDDIKIVCLNQGVIRKYNKFIYNVGMDYYLTLLKNKSVDNLVLFSFNGKKLRKLNSYNIFTGFSTSINTLGNMFMLSVEAQNENSKALNANGLTYFPCYILENSIKLSRSLTGILGTGGYSFFPKFSHNGEWFICGCTVLNFNKQHEPINKNVQLYRIVTG